MDGKAIGGLGVHSVVRKLQRIKEGPISWFEITLLPKDKGAIGQRQTAHTCHTGKKRACHTPFQLRHMQNHAIMEYTMDIYYEPHRRGVTAIVTRVLTYLLAT